MIKIIHNHYIIYIMKRLSFSLASIFVSIFIGVQADETYQINIEHVPNHGTHFVNPPFVPADMPDVYYDSDNEEIIIDGPGYATYYDVDIISVSTGYVVLYDTVNGTYGTVDISSLPDDNYTILITSSNNNEYEGSFTNY